MDGYARITRLAYREDGKVLVNLTVGNASGCEDIEFLILGELFDERFEEGFEELPDGSVELYVIGQLEELADVTAAFSSACASLAFSQCSAKALFRKLLLKGFSRSASEAAVGLCESKGYIGEVAMATRRAELMVAKPWGRSRIFARLREEGYSDAAMEAVAEYLDEVDFSEGCAKVIEKKFTCVPKERREREKMYASLSRLGFSSADIKAAISRIKHDE